MQMRDPRSIRLKVALGEGIVDASLRDRLATGPGVMQ